MTDQPRPPVPGDDPGPADSGHNAPAKRIALGTGQTMVLADYRQRFRARIVDTLVFGIAFALLSQVNDQAQWLDFDFIFLVALSILMINEVLAVAYCGRTLGMQFLGIRLVSKQAGKKPSVSASFFRWAFQIFWCLFAFGEDELGLVWIIITIPWWFLVHFSVYLDERRRGWHDLISGLIVVTADPPVPADPPGADAV